MNTPTLHQATILRFLFSAACIVIIIAGLQAGASLLLTPLLGLFIALICLPAQRWLRSRGLSSTIATSIVIVGMIGILLLIGVMLAGALAGLIERLPVYEASLAQRLQGITDALERMNIDLVALLSAEELRIGTIMSYIVGFLGGLINSGWFLFMVFLVFSYTLAESEAFAARFQAALGIDSPALNRLDAYTHTLSTFMSRQAVLGGAAAACDMLLLTMLGVGFPLIWGVLSFLCGFVPNLGYHVALTPPMILAFVQYGFGSAAAVFFGYLIINTFFDNLIYPRFMGHGLNLSSLVTFLAVVFWGWVLGPIGALLSLPLTLLIKQLILEAYPDSSWLAILLSERAPVALEQPAERATARPAPRA